MFREQLSGDHGSQGEYPIDKEDSRSGHKTILQKNNFFFINIFMNNTLSYQDQEAIVNFRRKMENEIETLKQFSTPANTTVTVQCTMVATVVQYLQIDITIICK